MAQIAPSDKLHHKVVIAAVLRVRLEHPHHRGMLDRRHHARPPEEARLTYRIARELAVQHLHGHALVPRSIVRLPDNGKAAPAQPLEEQIPPISQRIARLELPPFPELPPQLPEL